jgi:hypothetical protein
MHQFRVVLPLARRSEKARHSRALPVATSGVVEEVSPICLELMTGNISHVAQSLSLSMDRQSATYKAPCIQQSLFRLENMSRCSIYVVGVPVSAKIGANLSTGLLMTSTSSIETTPYSLRSRKTPCDTLSQLLTSLS